MSNEQESPRGTAAIAASILALIAALAVAAWSGSVKPAPGGKPALIFADGFESGRISGWDFKWLFRRASARVVSRPVRSGRHALEVSLRRSDPMRSKGKRSELAVPGRFRLGSAYWYGFSVFIPPGWKRDFKSEVVAQWFATRDKHLGERPRSPSLALRIKKSYWIITNRWDPRRVTPDNKSAPKDKIWKGAYERGKWTDWVFRVSWSHRADGLIEVFKNGVKVAEKNGPNTYNDQRGPILKIGIYKAPWNDPDAPSAVSSRLLYFDEIRIGGASAGYEAVAPRGERRR